MENITAEQQAILDSLIDPDKPEETRYEEDKPIQQEILCMMIRDKYFAEQSYGLIKPEYFVDKAHSLICKIVLDFFEQNKRKVLITKQHLLAELRLKLKDNPAGAYYFAELQSVLDSYEPDLAPKETLLQKVTEFAKKQAIRLAILKTIDTVQQNREDKYVRIEDLWKNTLQIGPNTDLGLEYFSTVEERYERMLQEDAHKERFSSGFDQIDKGLIGGGLSRGEIGAFMGMPGTGKTHNVNTNIIMYDGSIKNVKDIVVGDLVMGPDSKPRRVLSTHSLMDYGYKIIPTKGDSYVVNGKHILSFKNSHRSWNKKQKKYLMGFSTHFARMENTDIYNISVEDFLKENVSFQKKMKGWRVGVNWSYRNVKIDPYILGVWLGDGTSTKSEITNADKEVINEVKKYVKSSDLEYHSIDSIHHLIRCIGGGHKNNVILNDLKSYNLINNKHIPNGYKINSREVRLEILAGLIDSDGSLSCGGYDFVNKNKTLSEDVVFLARSLGLAAYIKPCKKKCQTGVEGDYWRVSISGDCSTIPVRIERKKCNERKQVKNVLLTGIKIVSTNVLEMFYGFEVDGDHLYLLHDFTVVHNSVSLVKSTVVNLNRGKKVLYVSLEMDQDKIAERFDAMLSGVPINELKERKDEVISALKKYRVTFKKLEGDLGDQKLFIKQFPAGNADVSTIRSFMSQLSLYGFKPDLLIIDYVGEFKDIPGMKKWESLQRIVRDLRGMAVEEQICILTAMQPNRAGRSAQEGEGFIDDSEIGDAFGQARPMDAIWSINMDKIEQEMKIGRIFVVKHRHGKSRYYFCFKQDQNTLDMIEIDQKKYMEVKSSHKDKVSDKVSASIPDKKFKPNSD